MKANLFSFRGSDGKEIHYYQWAPIAEPVAAVQIFHGMAEHAGRYTDFARFLNSRGLIVYADDHRGHGKTAGSVEKLGCLEADGFNLTVEDEYILTGIIKTRHPMLPVFVFAHSYGSFLGQEYMIRYGSEIAGIILSGTAARLGLDVSGGYMVAAALKKLYGADKKTPLIHRLTFGKYNQKIENRRSDFDWLSRDDRAVELYIEDPYCGTVFTTGFYYCLLGALKRLYHKERLLQIPQQLPVFIVNGTEDPLGKYGEDVNKLYRLYSEAGLKNLTMKLYQGGRHEMLQEVNRDEVYNDIAGWLNKQMP